LPPPQGDNLFAIMTSSVKPEGRDISQRHERRRAEPRPWVTCTEYLAKIERAVPEICSRTDTQANLLITILRSPNPKRPTVGKPGANVLDGGRCAGGRVSVRGDGATGHAKKNIATARAEYMMTSARRRLTRSGGGCVDYRSNCCDQLAKLLRHVGAPIYGDTTTPRRRSIHLTLHP